MTSPSINEMRIAVCEKLLRWRTCQICVEPYPPMGINPLNKEMESIPPLTLDWLSECEDKLGENWDTYHGLLWLSVGKSCEERLLNTQVRRLICATAEQRLRALYQTIK